MFVLRKYYNFNNSQNKTSNISARKNKLKARITNIDEKIIYRTNSSIRLNAGDKLDIPNSQKGNIFYLSVAGGFRIQEVLGSYSYHQPSNITNSLKVSNGDMIKLKII